MRRQKHKYNVYLVREGTGCYEGRSRYLVGQTWAVSDAQACNNVRFNTRNEKYPNGGPSARWIGDIKDEGLVSYFYEAELCI